MKTLKTNNMLTGVSLAALMVLVISGCDQGKNNYGINRYPVGGVKVGQSQDGYNRPDLFGSQLGSTLPGGRGAFQQETAAERAARIQEEKAKLDARKKEQSEERAKQTSTAFSFADVEKLKNEQAALMPDRDKCRSRGIIKGVDDDGDCIPNEKDNERHIPNGAICVPLEATGDIDIHSLIVADKDVVATTEESKLKFKELYKDALNKDNTAGIRVVKTNRSGSLERIFGDVVDTTSVNGQTVEFRLKDYARHRIGGVTESVDFEIFPPSMDGTPTKPYFAICQWITPDIDLMAMFRGPVGNRKKVEDGAILFLDNEGYINSQNKHLKGLVGILDFPYQIGKWAFDGNETRKSDQLKTDQLGEAKVVTAILFAEGKPGRGEVFYSTDGTEFRPWDTLNMCTVPNFTPGNPCSMSKEDWQQNSIILSDITENWAGYKRWAKEEKSGEDQDAPKKDDAPAQPPVTQPTITTAPATSSAPAATSTNNGSGNNAPGHDHPIVPQLKTTCAACKPLIIGAGDGSTVPAGDATASVTQQVESLISGTTTTTEAAINSDPIIQALEGLKEPVKQVGGSEAELLTNTLISDLQLHWGVTVALDEQNMAWLNKMLGARPILENLKDRRLPTNTDRGNITEPSHDSLLKARALVFMGALIDMRADLAERARQAAESKSNTSLSLVMSQAARQMLDEVAKQRAEYLAIKEGKKEMVVAPETPADVVASQDAADRLNNALKATDSLKSEVEKSTLSADRKALYAKRLDETKKDFQQLAIVQNMDWKNAAWNFRGRFQEEQAIIKSGGVEVKGRLVGSELSAALASLDQGEVSNWVAYANQINAKIEVETRAIADEVDYSAMNWHYFEVYFAGIW